MLTLLVLGANSADHASLYGVNGVQIWTEKDCQGIPASMVFNDTTLASNISNRCVSQSFRLLRPLQGKEQFDISITPGLGSDNKDYGINGLGCTSFVKSYFAINGTKGCHNTPPFTCHRLWVNSDLEPDLEGPIHYSTPLHTWPLMIPSSCYDTFKFKTAEGRRDRKV
ncbi:uncharacterized protein BDV14DRAFT_182285 [Aspergillus stella-maris]|uniref:uncharacterized protein n=1 Tax=Aspergillus stella-maris TaxID=1810926 RepID=UPI003CCCC6E8